MRRRWKSVALGLALAARVQGIEASPGNDVATCIAGRGEAAVVVDACSHALASGSMPARTRAMVYFARAQTWPRTRKYDQALTDYEQAILLDPANANAHIGRGTIWWIKGEDKRALGDFDEAIEINPQVAVAYSLRGFIHRRLNNLTLALLDCDQAIRLDPRQLSGYQCRAEALIDRGEADRALSDADMAIKIVPRNAPSYLARGRARSLRGETDLALEDFRTATALSPQYAAAYAYRGLEYEKKGDLVHAREDFEAARRSEGLAAYDVREARDIATDRLRLLDAAPAARPEIVNRTSPDNSAVADTGSSKVDKIVVPPGKRVALVIGNSQYRSVPVLANPRRDAATVAASLRAVGFQDVRLVNDVTREELVEALKSFANEADKADWAMIYYAGHGIEVGGVNYLVPVDAKFVADRDVQYEAVALDQVMAATEGAKKLHLVILDACRDNPFASQIKRTVASRSIGRGLAEVDPDSGTLVVYAAKHGQIALDGEGMNSPFVAAFVRRITTPQIEIRKLFDLVRDDVMLATGRRQQPFSYGSVPGSEDFYFVSTVQAKPQ